MADDVKDQAQTETAAQGKDGVKKDEPQKETKPEKKPEFDPEAFKADIAKDIEKRFKSEIDGLNRRNSVLEKERDDLQKETMTENESADYDLKAAKEEADKARREAQEFQLERIRLAKLYEAGLDESAAAFVGGGSEEEIAKRVKTLTEFIDRRASARVEAEVKKRFDAAGKPGGGEKPGGALTYEQVVKMTDAEIAKLPPESLDQFFKK